MRVPSYRVLAVTFGSAFSLLACAGILGDFTSAGTGVGSDGGSSGGGSSSGSGSGSGAGSSSGSGSGSGGASSSGSGSGSGSGGSSSGGADAGDAATPPLLNCQIQGGTVPQRLGSIPQSSSNYNPQLFNTSIGNQTMFRAVVREQGNSGPSIFHVYSFGQGGGGSVNDIPIPGANNVLSVVRYATGIGALMQGYVNNVNLLQVTTLENNASSWTAPVTITGPNDFGACNNNNNVQGGLVVNASSPADYTAVWSCEGVNANVLRAIRFTAGAGTSFDWPVPPVPDGGMPNSFGTGGLAQIGTSLYAIVNPPSNNGPPPAGSAPNMYVANATTFSMPATYPVPLSNATDFMLGITLAPTNNGKLGVSALEANLSSTTVYPIIYAGSVATTKVPTLKPSTDLGGATVNSLSELPIVNNGSAHWESFSGSPQSDNLIAVGSIYPNSNGLNFMWIDGTGRLVAERVGSKALFYFDTSDGGTGPALYGGDVVFNGAPLAALAGFEILYLQQGLDADGGPGVVIWANQMACVP